MALCVFCKIIRGEIPSSKIFESDKIFAFLDNAPLSKGHTIILPRHHSALMHEIPNDQLSELLCVAKKIAIAQGLENYNILQNNGTLAYQAIPHVHFHLIPRFRLEEGLGIRWPFQMADRNKLRKLAEDIRLSMESADLVPESMD